MEGRTEATEYNHTWQLGKAHKTMTSMDPHTSKFPSDQLPPAAVIALIGEVDASAANDVE